MNNHNGFNHNNQNNMNNQDNYAYFAVPNELKLKYKNLIRLTHTQERDGRLLGARRALVMGRLWKSMEGCLHGTKLHYQSVACCGTVAEVKLLTKERNYLYAIEHEGTNSNINFNSNYNNWANTANYWTNPNANANTWINAWTNFYPQLPPQNNSFNTVWEPEAEYKIYNNNVNFVDLERNNWNAIQFGVPNNNRNNMNNQQLWLWHQERIKGN